MKLLIDDTDLIKIEDIYSKLPIDGVTTNPTLIAKSGKNPYVLLKEIRKIIGFENELHVQVVSNNSKNIEEEAKIIADKLGNNTFIKIPAYNEGFKAIENLSKEGLNVTATAIYSPMQAFLAAKSGAMYVAPYINRIDNLGYDGVKIALQIQKIIENNNFKTELLAASFKNSTQVLKLIEKGVGAITCSSDIIYNLVEDQNITYAIEKFNLDFQKLYGIDITLKDFFNL